METFSKLLVPCEGKSPVIGEFPSQRPVTRSFDVFFDLRLNKRLSKPARRRWFEPPSRSLWRRCNGYLSWIAILIPHTKGTHYEVGRYIVSIFICYIKKRHRHIKKCVVSIPPIHLHKTTRWWWSRKDGECTWWPVLELLSWSPIIIGESLQLTWRLCAVDYIPCDT